MASQLPSAIKRTGHWIVSYFTNDPSNQKDAYSGSKVEFDVEAVENAGNDRLPNSPPVMSATSSQIHSPASSSSSSSSSSTSSLPISSAPQQPKFQSESKSQTQTDFLNPIAKAFRELEMGKSFLTFILPTATMILALHGKDSSPGVLYSILCLLSFSLVALLYGMSLRDLFPPIANASEQLGIACIYASFFIVVASHLPRRLFWIPLICFMASVQLSICSCLPVKKKANTNTKAKGLMLETLQK
ncbi:hypothetical protein LOK49_Contig138G00008 [Camellia lanceoleosa]|nr:hypothetical protein LOK49_Contig138G00008 [Camellia lanceoleosa]